MYLCIFSITQARNSMKIWQTKVENWILGGEDNYPQIFLLSPALAHLGMRVVVKTKIYNSSHTFSYQSFLVRAPPSFQGMLSLSSCSEKKEYTKNYVIVKICNTDYMTHYPPCNATKGSVHLTGPSSNLLLDDFFVLRGCVYHSVLCLLPHCRHSSIMPRHWIRSL